jgi:hypothetical protein
MKSILDEIGVKNFISFNGDESHIEYKVDKETCKEYVKKYKKQSTNSWPAARERYLAGFDMDLNGNKISIQYGKENAYKPYDVNNNPYIIIILKL